LRAMTSRIACVKKFDEATLYARSLSPSDQSNHHKSIKYGTSKSVFLSFLN